MLSARIGCRRAEAAARPASSEPSGFLRAYFSLSLALPLALPLVRSVLLLLPLMLWLLRAPRARLSHARHMSIAGEKDPI